MSVFRRCGCLLILWTMIAGLLDASYRPPRFSYFNKIRSGDVTFHQNGWPENSSIEVAQEIWSRQEDSMKSALERIIKPVFPRLIRTGSEADISPECQAAMLKMILGVRSLKTWALHMVDASGKLPNGLFSGTAATLGHFEQCLAVSVGDEDDGGFRGKYCYVKTAAPNLPRPTYNSSEIVEDSESILNWFYRNAYWIQQFGSRLGVCVPSHCTNEDISKMTNYAFSSINGAAKVLDCYVDEGWTFDGLQKVVICCVGLMLAFCLTCTIYELFSTTNKSSRTHLLLLNFSAIQNSGKIFKMSSSKRNIRCLYGIRTISCGWIVLGHIYFMTDLDSFARFASLRKLEDLFSSFLFTVVENFSLPVDTFFAITGLLLIWTSRDDELKPFSYRSWASQIFRRIYRIYPCYLLLHGLYILMPAFGQGPMWNEVFSNIRRNVYETSWTNLIFVNNFVQWSDNLMLHSWFIAVNMQLFIVGVPLAHALRRRPRLTSVIMAMASLLGCVVVCITLAVNEYPPAMLMMTAQYDKAVNFISYVYYMPYTHLGPFCMGMLLGYLLTEGYSPKLNTVQILLGNISALLLMAVSVFGAYPFRAGWPIDYKWIVLYGGFHRIVWTAGVCWFILTSVTGQGGIISAFLSADLFQPFSVLSFTVYLLHPALIIVYVALTKEIQQLDHFYMTVLFLGIWTLSHMAAYVMCTIAELPFAGLEKLLREKPMNNLKISTNKKQKESRRKDLVCIDGVASNFEGVMGQCEHESVGKVSHSIFRIIEQPTKTFFIGQDQHRLNRPHEHYYTKPTICGGLQPPQMTSGKLDSKTFAKYKF
ncbi:nose resistant to fluoxetine protein 6-like isoform X1 [Varroa jacobsoni]|uniref:nose resistant to fluoxetine protein 6-like isoform X1 n=2 Tax=Varroa jacobsoni TaxID=62625 RepID=UPI000BF7D096|nr:nose resistant to fluoxetine protein 6-like isoform X1 [Varroa jacobsoni]